MRTTINLSVILLALAAWAVAHPTYGPIRHDPMMAEGPSESPVLHLRSLSNSFFFLLLAGSIHPNGIEIRHALYELPPVHGNDVTK